MITKSGAFDHKAYTDKLWTSATGATKSNYKSGNKAWESATTPKPSSSFGDKVELASDAIGMVSKGAILTLGAGIALKHFVNKIQNDTRRKAIIEDLMLTDPIIKGAPIEQVMSFYATINNVAPSIATDKNVVKELLQQCIKFGTIDLNMIKMLAETHGVIDKNKNMGLERYLG